MATIGEIARILKTLGYVRGGGGGSGTPGADGATWYTGSTAPAAGLGKDTDLYLNTTTGDVYKRAGTWSIIASLKGTNGTSGNTIISGALTPPTSGIGNNGDFYLNTSTFVLYGPKAGGSWPGGVSLIGANGSNGNTILTTSGSPSNATGNNGDFAYDPTAKIMYGPKASGAWPGGVALSGAAGTAGNTILSVSGAPSSGLGNNGDYAYDASAKTIYGPKASNVWPAGVTLAGNNGANGNTIITTSGAPSNGTGANGDYAYDPTAKMMYGPKAAGAWPAGVLLKGSDGVGTNGTNGNTIITTSGQPSNGVGVNGDYAYDPSTKTMYGPKASGAWPAGVVLSGTNGLNGNTILTTSGTPGSGVGNNGDFAYDPTTKTMYGPKSGGAWPGGTVLAGTNGTNGNTILSTSGAPSNATGNNGDYAYDASAKTMYGPKAAGVWPAGVTLSGSPGSNGTNGNTILTTSGAPSSGTGANGDYAYDPAAKLIYGPKSGGAWPGGVSLAGTNGINGATILSGTATPPASGVGNNGDFYLNTATSVLYGPKSGGVWPAGVSIKGADGASGSLWVTGTGAPSDADGNPNGTMYLDITTNGPYNFYKKVGGTYGSALGSLRGPQGNNGTADLSSVHMYLDGTDTVSVRNGTTAQALRVYRTTDGTNGDFFTAAFSGGNLRIGTDKIGTGTGGDVILRRNGVDLISIGATAATPFTDSSYDLGATNARWLRVHSVGLTLGHSVKTASYTLTGPTEPYVFIGNSASAMTFTMHANPLAGEEHSFYNVGAGALTVSYTGRTGTVNKILAQDQSIQLAFDATLNYWTAIADSTIVPAQRAGVWTTGTGAPSNGVGIDGDMYLDTASGDYYKRSSGTYTKIGNLSSGGTGTLSASVDNISVFTSPGSGQFILPATATAFAWADCHGAAGGCGFGAGQGGGAGAFSRKNTPNFTAGVTNTYNHFVGTAGTSGNGTTTTGTAGGDSWVLNNTTCLAKGGTGGARNTTTACLGGQASAGFGDVKFSGGSGGGSSADGGSGGGGGAAGSPSGNGGNGTQGQQNAAGGLGGASPSAGTGGIANTAQSAAPTAGASNPDGGGGGGGCSDNAGGTFNTAGNGGYPGGAAGSGQYNKLGGTSANGQVRYKYTTTTTYNTLGNIAIAVGISGKVNNERCLLMPVTEKFAIPANATLSKGGCPDDEQATATTVYTLYKNSTQFGTATFSAGSSVATFSVSAVTVFDPANGDRLIVRGPATADATLADASLVIMGLLLQ